MMSPMPSTKSTSPFLAELSPSGSSVSCSSTPTPFSGHTTLPPISSLVGGSPAEHKGCHCHSAYFWYNQYTRLLTQFDDMVWSIAQARAEVTLSTISSVITRLYTDIWVQYRANTSHRWTQRFSPDTPRALSVDELGQNFSRTLAEDDDPATSRPRTSHELDSGYTSSAD